MSLTPSKILLISAPSGAGKTTLIHALNKRHPLKFSISHTTRKPRAGEKDGVDYFFVNTREFHDLQANNAFIETAEIHGNLYGTGWDNVSSKTESDSWLILDVDSQGFFTVKHKVPNLVSIFILPPQLQDLKNRILKRQPDIDLEELNTRLKAAQQEISNAFDYDYVIVNQRVEDAVDELSFIIRCETLRSIRRHELIQSFCS